MEEYKIFTQDFDGKLDMTSGGHSLYQRSEHQGYGADKARLRQQDYVKKFKTEIGQLREPPRETSKLAKFHLEAITDKLRQIEGKVAVLDQIDFNHENQNDTGVYWNTHINDLEILASQISKDLNAFHEE